MVVGNILGPDGIIVIVVVGLVLLFGGSKLPGLARSLGSASHEFKRGMEDGSTDGKADGKADAKAEKKEAGSD
ncbi:MAG TPA: twin-arginine translocase TatA/TatE family subunit [Acidimicrobiales bacterium]|jgi:sec-independent protein translocase protein TatA|nr:twin-arginine translocase TatA/TatE family subunit [Acidimicrobiales bacterium]